MSEVQRRRAGFPEEIRGKPRRMALQRRATHDGVRQLPAKLFAQDDT
jgi:hypothetical protein